MSTWPCTPGGPPACGGESRRWPPQRRSRSATPKPHHSQGLSSERSACFGNMQCPTAVQRRGLPKGEPARTAQLLPIRQVLYTAQKGRRPSRLFTAPEGHELRRKGRRQEARDKVIPSHTLWAADLPCRHLPQIRGRPSCLATGAILRFASVPHCVSEYVRRTGSRRPRSWSGNHQRLTDQPEDAHGAAARTAQQQGPCRCHLGRSWPPKTMATPGGSGSDGAP